MSNQRRASRRLSRRAFLKATGTVAFGAAAYGGFTPCFAALPPKGTRKVVLVQGVQTVEPTEAFFSSVPIGLGFYEEEGLQVEIQPLAGSSAAVQLLANGKAQFSSHGTAGLFSGVNIGVDMRAFICQVPDYFVSVAVPKDSPITSFDQLKGKTIGINAVGGSPHLTMQGVLAANGWDPEKDVQFLAVGTGVPALNALQRGRVQALAEWDSVFAEFEFHGGQFRYFRPDPIPKMGFTHTTNCLAKTIQEDPELVIRMARAMCKSMVIMAAADKTELAKLHQKVFPETKSTGMSTADAIRMDVLKLKAREPFCRYPERVFRRTEKLGDIRDEQITMYRDLMLRGKQIKEALPADRYFTRQFVDAMNKIDFDGLLKMAKGLTV